MDAGRNFLTQRSGPRAGEFAQQEIFHMRDGGPGNVLGSGVFTGDARDEVQVEAQEQPLDEGGAIHGTFAGEEVFFGAKLRVFEGDEGADEFADGIAFAPGD